MEFMTHTLRKQIFNNKRLSSSHYILITKLFFQTIYTLFFIELKNLLLNLSLFSKLVFPIMYRY